MKSRNAHMKSHSLKVLAEREANAVLKNAASGAMSTAAQQQQQQQHQQRSTINSVESSGGPTVDPFSVEALTQGPPGVVNMRNSKFRDLQESGGRDMTMNAFINVDTSVKTAGEPSGLLSVVKPPRGKTGHPQQIPVGHSGSSGLQQVKSEVEQQQHTVASSMNNHPASMLLHSHSNRVPPLPPPPSSSSCASSSASANDVSVLSSSLLLAPSAVVPSSAQSHAPFHPSIAPVNNRTNSSNNNKNTNIIASSNSRIGGGGSGGSVGSSILVSGIRGSNPQRQQQQQLAIIQQHTSPTQNLSALQPLTCSTNQNEPPALPHNQTVSPQQQQLQHSPNYILQHAPSQHISPSRNPGGNLHPLVRSNTTTAPNTRTTQFMRQQQPR